MRGKRIAFGWNVNESLNCCNNNVRCIQCTVSGSRKKQKSLDQSGFRTILSYFSAANTLDVSIFTDL